MGNIWLLQEADALSRGWRTDFWEWLQAIEFQVNAMRLVKLLLIAILVLVVGRKLIKWSVKLLGKAFAKANVEEGVARFMTSLARIALTVVLVVILMHVMGLETSSLVALVASAGLTVGLALQGSLSNFAGGVLILLLKPFHVGDYIIAMGNEGVVTGIDVFYTKLMTNDNRVVVIPNGALSNSSVVNVTSEPIRHLSISTYVGYDADVQKVKELLWEIVRKNEKVMGERETNVFIKQFEPRGIEMGLCAWVAGGDYGSLRCELLEAIKMEFDKNGVKLV